MKRFNPAHYGEWMKEDERGNYVEFDQAERYFKAKAAEELAMKRPPDSVQRAWLLDEAQKYREGE